MKPSEHDNKIRLQVFLSHSGVCSRRRALEIIQEGRVTVNQKIIEEPSTPVDPQKDQITVDGKPVAAKQYEYILLHKPQGYVTTRADKFAKKTVYDLLPAEFHHLVPAGRLDQDTEGLLLFTNDGDLVFDLTHPSKEVSKTYFVRVKGLLSPQTVNTIQTGIVLEEKKTWPAQIEHLEWRAGNTEFCITIHEGRKRQIRRMLEAVSYPVMYLQRIQEGSLKLGALKSGQWRRLTTHEIQRLKKR
jgi:pseudouridine synthase